MLKTKASTHLQQPELWIYHPDRTSTHSIRCQVTSAEAGHLTFQVNEGGIKHHSCRITKRAAEQGTP